MKKAVIITENKYPCEDAGAIRQHATAKILQALGYDVFVAGYGASTGKEEREYDGVKFYSFRPASKNKLIRIAFRVFSSFRMFRYICKHHSDADILLVVDVLPFGFRLFERFAKKRKIPLIHDSVEWYSPEEYANGTKNREYRLKEITNCKIIKAPWRVMAISSYLQEHFSKKCEKVARIPVIMDMESIAYRIDSKEQINKTRFVYAGGPGWKDYIKEIVAAFALLNPEEISMLELHFVGITKDQLVSICRADDKHIQKLGDSLFAHGRVPHAEAVEWVKKADFTLLLRDASLRYAKAGFPTKIVESLSCGTPPVCNLSSDLALYLEDGNNAFLADDHSPESLCKALRKALATSSEERSAMRQSARKTAEEKFDYRFHISEFSRLVDN